VTYPEVMLDLDRSFGFLVNDVARLFGRRFDYNGGRLGLTRAQCRTLGYLARNEGINQAGLADLLEIRPMTLVRQIDRMEEAGWIERHPDPADRRARRLFLTAKARPILGRIWHVANETRDEALALLSPLQAETLIELLRRVHATLSANSSVNSSATATKRLPVDGAGQPAIPAAIPAATLPARRASAPAAIAKAVPEGVGGKLPAVEAGR
jgi:MarR family transcriptional regulator for hemolysin